VRWSFERVSPALVVALLATAFLLVGLIAFLVNAMRPRSVEVTVDVRATPTPVVVGVTVPSALSPTPVPTLVPPPTPTSAPLATVPPTPTPLPTPPPPTRPPTPPAAEPAAAQPAPAPPQAAPPPPQPAAPAPTPPPTPAPLSARPPAQAATAESGAQPSGPGGFGNTQQDFDAAYGKPVGRTPDGLDIYQTERADIQVAFREGRAERLRFVLRNDRVMALAEARDQARRLSPKDAQPVSTTGEESGKPVDQFRSAALAAAFDRASFRNAEPGTFSVAFMTAGRDAVNGFEMRLEAGS
jgi:hypothetical protein